MNLNLLRKLLGVIRVGSSAVLGCCFMARNGRSRFVAENQCPVESVTAESSPSAASPEKCDPALSPFSSLDPSPDFCSLQPCHPFDAPKSQSLSFGFESFRLVVKPTEIKRFWRRLLCPFVVCSYSGCDKQPNEKS